MGRMVAVSALVLLWVASPARAQIGDLASPGPLAAAHASLQGIANCQRCHTPGRQVDAAKCLSCHRPIADRIARKWGVHRNVTGNCANCHAEHMGADADLRHFDRRTFDHAVDAGFRLDGGHAKVAAACAACHKQRSFLAVKASCASCHADPHAPTLGTDCARCHSAAVAFRQARGRFDHGATRFLLTGAHREVACEKCHAGGAFGGLAFGTCAACHKAPHRASLGTCTTCHTTVRWATRTVQHDRTRFPLAGLHARVACEGCHAQGLTTPIRFDTCVSCHANPHRASLPDDCRACHTVNGFGGAAFDHGARTAFPLTDRHATLACTACHRNAAASAAPAERKVVDFGGLAGECVSCHRDPHEGRFGTLCDACHRATTFRIATFVHPRDGEFFTGGHAGVACAKCHVRPELQFARREAPSRPAHARVPQEACRMCHVDVHLGQLGGQCERCHAVSAVRFAASKFSHDEAAFPLTGRHRALECVKCHPVQAGVFPAGSGTAARVSRMPGTCTSCHADPHMGQVDGPCSRCHATETFRVVSYEHQNLESVFGVGGHARLACQRCHRKEEARFPAGVGVAVRLKGLGRACLDCH